MPPALKPPLQLAIDTSSRLTSIYVASGTDTLAALAVRANDRRSERLWSEMDFLLREIGLSVDDVDLFSVCTGPGGFTGIRVGMAAAKGLAMARRRPLIGVTSLEAVAAAAPHSPAVLVMTRAHRSRADQRADPSQLNRLRPDQAEVFSQMFRYESGDAPGSLDSPLASSAEEALERAAGIERLVVAGDGARDNLHLIEGFVRRKIGRKRRKWVLGPSPDLLAPLIARIALARYSRGESADPAHVKACYVRPAQAETKLALGLVGPGLRP
jgi:tRNA threonylcarbamoyl adenosine modification protein YeaZ